MIKKLFNNKKKKILFVFLLPILSALIVEMVFFNGINIYKMRNDKGIFSVEDGDIDHIITEKVVKNEVKINENQTNNNIFEDVSDEKQTIIVEKTVKNETIKIDLHKKYINKIRITYSVNNDQSNYFEYKTFDEYGNPSKYGDYIRFEKEFNTIIKNISKKSDRLEISLGENENNLVIKNIEIINVFQFNAIRFLFIYIIFFSLILIYVLRDKLSEKLEIFFLIVCLGTGISMILCTPNITHYSWDDHIHFKKVYSLLEQDKVEYTKSYEYAVKNRNMQVYEPETLEEISNIDNYLDTHNIYNDSNIEEKDSNFISFNDYAYLPSAIIVKICKFFKIPFSIMFKCGKLINLLIYCGIIFYAIKSAKMCKRLIFVVSLIPTNIFLATQYSKDPYTTAFLLLGFSSFLNCYFCNNKLDKKTFMIMIISFVLGSLSKAIYIPFLLLILTIPKEKFINKKQSTIIKILIVVLLLAVMSTFILPNIVNPGTVGDIRGGNTSTSRQLSLIFNQPVSFAKVFVPYVKNIFIDYFFTTISLMCFCNLGIMSGNLYYLIFFMLLFVALTDNEQKKPIKAKVKIYLLLLILLVICLICGSMYLSFTSVGNISISGVQPRYFLPLIFPLLLLFNFKGISNRFNKSKYNLFIILTMGFILFYCIYTKVFLFCCI